MINRLLNSSLAFDVIKLSDTITKIYEKICNTHGITTQQWQIMLLLANDISLAFNQHNLQKKPLMASDLSVAMEVSRANITNLVNVLIEKKIIDQKVDEIDKRKKRLVLTKKGLDIINAVQPMRVRCNESLFMYLTQAEKETFAMFIAKCNKALE